MAPAPTVYIVDDDDAVRDSLRILFNVEGLAVRDYASAQAFLDDHSAVLSGCLVTDVHMSGMTGLQLVHELRARRVDLPVVMISGRMSPALAAGVMAAGATAFVEKPFGPDEIVGAVRAAIARDESRGI
jgi:FixJ family two-component response regulator